MNDKRHGIGLFSQVNGSTYHGSWKEDTQTGRAVLKWANGNAY